MVWEGKPRMTPRCSKAGKPRRVPSRAELQRQVTELLEQQAAISEVLRAIARSPDDLQPVFDTILDSAARLSRARGGAIRLCEENGLRLVARTAGSVPGPWSPPTLLERYSLFNLLAATRSPIHVPDLAAHEVFRRGDDSYIVNLVNLLGIRTFLLVPMLKDQEIIGVISLDRDHVEPFTDAQIGLFTDFSAQATIALESTRRERQHRELQTALARASRVAAVEHLTASIADEVNQPLTAIASSGNAGLRWLTRSAPDIEAAKRSLERIIRDAGRASGIIAQLRELTMKKAPQQQELFNLNEAILEVAALTSGETIKNGVTLSTKLAPRLPRIHGDRVQLQQVMMNLVVNAIQAMSGVGENKRDLQISTEMVEPHGVLVGVRDTGPGLSPESLPRLFEPFYTTKPDGMGMGLSICRSIVEAHGGRLLATTCAPQGALFEFTLPIS
jgi:C4-dicarboxylate-specific signal transduction histidine kinase